MIKLIDILSYGICTDEEAIYKWIIGNNKESWAIECLSKVAINKINDTEHLLWLHKDKLCFANSDLYLNYDNSTAHNLDFIERISLLKIELTEYKDLYNWAIENIPHMERPEIYNRETIKYLYGYGIEFKNDKTLK